MKLPSGLIGGLMLAVALLPAFAAEPGEDAYSRAVATLDSSRSDAIEGIWEFNPLGGGAVVAITAKPGSRGIYELRLLESPDWRVEPGALCGEVFEAAGTGRYDCRLVAAPGGDAKPGFGAYTATLELGDGARRFTLKPYSRHRKVNFHRWIPYFFRVTIERTDPRPSDLEGAVRIYPPTDGTRPVNL